ncbi:polynucleotide kinase 3 phosphatase domain-containing protein [Ditylenchus destructor]|nr:polynucleotide kinase 3 phosphatase domain-containing protein [Ditylenchus destructor]
MEELNVRKRKLTSDSTEAEQSLPKVMRRMHDKLEIRDISRLEGIDKKEAALKLVQKRRRSATMDGDGKLKVAQSNLPWAPNQTQLKFPKESFSCLSKDDHKRYVAIVSNDLTSKPQFRFEHNKLEIQALDERLQGERGRFENLAFGSVKNWNKLPFNHQQSGARELLMKMESAKIEAVLGDLAFREIIDEMDWPRVCPNVDSSQKYRPVVEEVLQEGQWLRVLIPDVRRLCRYETSSNVIKERIREEPADKTIINNDEKMIQWALDRGIPYLMDGSTLRQLMSNRWPHRNQSFAHRVTVTRRVHAGSIQRLCVISKPVLASPLDILHVNRQFSKWSMKATIRDKFAPNSSKLKTSKKLQPHPNVTTIVPTTEPQPMEPEPTQNLVIQKNEPMDEIEVSNSITSQPSSSTSSQQPDLLGSILDSMESSIGHSVESDKSSTASVFASSLSEIKQENEPGFNREKRYMVMNFDQEGDHKILVRTRNHGVDQHGIQLCINIKNEFLPEIGSDKMFTEEELWNLITFLLKNPAAQEQCVLYIHPKNMHCIQMKRTSGNSYLSRCSEEAKNLLYSRTQRMCALMDTLEKLDVGEYLLYPQGSTMKILKQDIKSDIKEEEKDSMDQAEPVDQSIGDEQVFNKATLESQCVRAKPQLVNDVGRVWNGLNPHLPLAIMPKRKNENAEADGCEDGPAVKYAPIFTPKASMQGTWKIVPNELYIFTTEGIEHREKIAGFDMDGTLIKTKSGNVFGKNSDDWQLWDSAAVISELTKAHKSGFKLCIFTNQKGIQLGSVKPNEFKMKIQAICSRIGLPIQVFVSPGTANYRKPYAGMWERLEKLENGGVSVDRSRSIYVGDAAGRIRTTSRNKPDHSSADRLFALNVNVEFQTPEQYFLKKMDEEPYKLPDFNPSSIIEGGHSLFNPENTQIPPKDKSQEVIVLVGSPASGKSTLAASLAKKHKNYAIVNQDELKTWQACVKSTKQHLDDGRSVIVDNTNRDAETRHRYVELAKSLSIPCRCFVIQSTQNQSAHINTFRHIVNSDEQHKKVSDNVIRMFYGAYKPPTSNEGFDEIVKVNFVPNFADENHKRIFLMHLLEK